MSFALYFAMGSNNPFLYEVTFGRWDWKSRPINILASFAIPGAVRGWKTRTYDTYGAKAILDSGAYSFWKSGVTVDINQLIQEAKSGCWDEVAALDVIGNPAASLFNAGRMKEAGLNVLPVFHYGEPWDLLHQYKKEFDNRVALGGITSVGMTKKLAWLGQCFARAYPCKFHGFGIGTREVLMEYPFISADSSSWGSALQYGRSSAVPGLYIPKVGEGDRTENYDLRYEIKKYCELEAEIQDRWKSELQWSV